VTAVEQAVTASGAGAPDLNARPSAVGGHAAGLVLRSPGKSGRFLGLVREVLEGPHQRRVVLDDETADALRPIGGDVIENYKFHSNAALTDGGDAVRCDLVDDEC
jgi:hypothetical protein